MDPSSSSCRVQQVTKASSDQLLRKFAELDSDPPPNHPKRTHLIRPARRKRATSRALPLSSRDLPNRSHDSIRRYSSGADWNSALLATPSWVPSKRKGARARQIAGVGFVLEVIERALRRTINGAPRALVDRHCNSHVRLISDAV